MKHKGDRVDLIVGGVEVMKVITKEEFIEGCKRISQGNNPLDGAMNPPESGRRTRRTKPDEAASEGEAAEQTAGARTRRTRRTR